MAIVRIVWIIVSVILATGLLLNQILGLSNISPDQVLLYLLSLQVSYLVIKG